ncbi:MAG: DUF1786 domain-containing protein [Desulfohalobiaceae bacterium]
MSILCLDIGSGTQDALYFQPGQELMNCPKFILPSPARLVAQRIQELTSRGKGIHLYGQTMGGGFGRALQEHLQAGLKASAQPRAAYSLADDLQRVRAKGVRIEESCPQGHTPLYLADFDPGFWRSFLSLAGLEYPDLILAAAQDHGFHPDSSNRQGRFRLWKELLDSTQGRMQDLLFESVPGPMTRLQEIQAAAGNCLVTDTGSAAVLGALFVPEVQELSRNKGVCVLNLGNSHTIAFLIYQDQVFAIYEHHTGMLEPKGLLKDMERFRQGSLSEEEVFQAGGHGCYINPELQGLQADFQPMFVLGPRRDMLRDQPVRFPAPGGDMMLAGCYGLLQGYKYKSGREELFAGPGPEGKARGCGCGCK